MGPSSKDARANAVSEIEKWQAKHDGQGGFQKTRLRPGGGWVRGASQLPRTAAGKRVRCRGSPAPCFHPEAQAAAPHSRTRVSCMQHRGGPEASQAWGLGKCRGCGLHTAKADPSPGPTTYTDVRVPARTHAWGSGHRPAIAL